MPDNASPDNVGADLITAGPPPQAPRARWWVALAAVPVAGVLFVAFALAGGWIGPVHQTQTRAGAALLDAPGPRTGQVVDRDQAELIADAAWTQRERALRTGDGRAIAGQETGSARTSDLDRIRCHCFVPTTVETITDQQTYLPDESSYPAYFITEILTANTDETDVTGRVAAGTADGYRAVFLVVRRQARTSPWHIDLVAQWVNRYPVTIEPSSNPDGYDSATAGESAVARQAPGRLAAYLDRAATTGNVPPDHWFLPGVWTSALAAADAQHANGTRHADGLTATITYRADPADPVYVVSTGEGTLGCGVVHRAATYTPYDGNAPSQDVDRDGWGRELAPGVYREVDIVGDEQTCFSIPLGYAGRDTEVLGGAAGAESLVTGVSDLAGPTA